VALQKQEGDANESPDPMGAEAEKCRRDLHRYLARCLRSDEEANDLAQEAYLRYLQIPDAGVLRKPAGYLFRIALNLLYEWRHRRDRSPVTFDSDLADKRADVWADAGADIYEQLTSREHLQKVLDAIPFNYRQVLWMNKVEGLTYHEIAVKLNLRPDTVLNYLARAAAHARRVQFD
jgi:RNA polymerase sigma factor (sigma-70 family)